MRGEDIMLISCILLALLLAVTMTLLYSTQKELAKYKNAGKK